MRTAVTQCRECDTAASAEAFMVVLTTSLAPKTLKKD